MFDDTVPLVELYMVKHRLF